MSLTIKQLATVQLGTTSNQPVYRPAAGKSALVKTIILANRSTTTAVTVHVTIRTSANNQLYLHPSAVQIAANARLVLADDITLSNVNATGDVLEMWAGASGGPVDVSINGVERDIQ